MKKKDDFERKFHDKYLRSAIIMKPEQIELIQSGFFFHEEFLYLFCLILRKIGLGKKILYFI